VPSQDEPHLPKGRPRPFWTRHLRAEVQFGLDLVVLTAAFVVSYLLRFDFSIPADYLRNAPTQLPVVVLIQFASVLLVGIYSFVWRYVGLTEVKAFVRAAAYSALLLLALRLGLPGNLDAWRVPRSIILLDTLLAFGGLLGIRVVRRVLYERFERNHGASGATEASASKRALLVGAGSAGVLASRELRGRGNRDIEPIGFVDDDPRKQGTVINGLKVLGSSTDLTRLISDLAIERVIITMTASGSGVIRSILDAGERAGVEVRIVPTLHEIVAGQVAVSRFREVQIEDLLGRDPVRLDDEKVRDFVAGKCVLLTGAGGSIGGELANQIARFNPLRLVLVERSEGALFEVERKLKDLWPQINISSFLGDVSDASRTAEAFRRWRPHVVFHAGAHKHVPMMESHPSEAVRNNILATRSLGRIAGEYGVETFVLVSTDKAVRPSSVMGASKRVAELLIQDLATEFDRSRFLAVRFGNVLGSAGSVVPIFREQIGRGGPVTVTHPDAIRYFMTPSEAAQLVLEAGAIGAGGDILILDMGEPVKILELAKDMITLSGYKAFNEIPIIFTGLRPGEKLSEELELSGEDIDRTTHPKVFRGRLAAYHPDEVRAALDRLQTLAEQEDQSGIRRFLSEFLPEANLERREEPRPEPPAARPQATIN